MCYTKTPFCIKTMLTPLPYNSNSVFRSLSILNVSFGIPAHGLLVPSLPQFKYHSLYHNHLSKHVHCNLQQEIKQRRITNLPHRWRKNPFQMAFH